MSGTEPDELFPLSNILKQTVLPTPAFKRILGLVDCESCTENKAIVYLKSYK